MKVSAWNCVKIEKWNDWRSLLGPPNMEHHDATKNLSAF